MIYRQARPIIAPCLFMCVYLMPYLLPGEDRVLPGEQLPESQAFLFMTSGDELKKTLNVETP